MNAVRWCYVFDRSERELSRFNDLESALGDGNDGRLPVLYLELSSIDRSDVIDPLSLTYYAPNAEDKRTELNRTPAESCVSASQPERAGPTPAKTKRSVCTSASAGPHEQ